MIKYTRLKDTGRKDLRALIPLKKPFTLLIEPTSLCNFQCIQCFQSIPGENRFTQNRQHMSLELFNKVIEDARRWGGDPFKVLKLSLFGEPTANPHFPEMIRIARQAELAERMETTTNASLLIDAVALSMIENEMDYLRVSIYASNQEEHQRITGGAVSLQRIYENLQNLQVLKRRAGKQKPFVAVKMLDTFSEDNRRFEDLFAPVADEVYIDRVHNWVPYEGKDFVESLYGGRTEEVRASLKASQVHREACSLPFFTLAVRSNGDVTPCCIDWIGGTIVGNVHDESLQDIWCGDRMDAFWRMQLEHRQHENQSCAGCEYYFDDYYIKDCVDGAELKRVNSDA